MARERNKNVFRVSKSLNYADIAVRKIYLKSIYVIL